MEVSARNCMWRKKLGAEMEDLDEGRDSGRNVWGMGTLPQMSLLQLLSALCEQMCETN